MIVGVGVDVVDIARLGERLDRTPALRGRVFTPSEPVLAISGAVAERAELLGVARMHLSLSHDGGIATAMVVAESA